MQLTTPCQAFCPCPAPTSAQAAVTHIFPTFFTSLITRPERRWENQSCSVHACNAARKAMPCAVRAPEIPLLPHIFSHRQSHTHSHDRLAGHAAARLVPAHPPAHGVDELIEPHGHALPLSRPAHVQGTIDSALGCCVFGAPTMGLTAQVWGANDNAHWLCMGCQPWA